MIQLISSSSFQLIEHQLKSVLKTLDSSILVEKIDASSVAIEDWMAEINQPSLFSVAKITLIYQAYFFGKTGRTSSVKQQAETTLLEFLSQDHPDIHVIFIYEGEIDERLAFVKSIKKHHQWIDLPLPSKDEWVNLLEGWQHDLHVQLSPKAFARFILSTYPDLDRAYQELKKLSVYGTMIEESTIVDLVKPNLEENVFELTNQLMAENIKQALKIYRDFTTLQVEPT
jgi:DNA polymerase-3 subunit delta